LGIELAAGAVVSALTEIIGSITIGGKSLPTWAKYLCVILLGSIITTVLVYGNFTNDTFTKALVAVITAAFGTHATAKAITKTAG